MQTLFTHGLCGTCNRPYREDTPTVVSPAEQGQWGPTDYDICPACIAKMQGNTRRDRIRRRLLRPLTDRCRVTRRVVGVADPTETVTIYFGKHKLAVECWDIIRFYLAGQEITAGRFLRWLFTSIDDTYQYDDFVERGGGFE